MTIYIEKDLRFLEFFEQKECIVLANVLSYKQIHGCAMGSPVRLALLWALNNKSNMPPKRWFRYVDDVFSTIKKHALTNFYNLLISIDPHINFTAEQELDGKLSFLDTLIITRNNGSLSIDVYQKPIHTLTDT